MRLAVTLVPTQVNPVVGDMSLNDTGTGMILLSDLAQETAQQIAVRLNFFRGEWFLNLDSGTPYYQHILRKGVSDRMIRSIFGQVITTCPGVDSLVKLNYVVTPDRRLQLTFQARLKTGELLKSSDFAPFVIET